MSHYKIHSVEIINGENIDTKVHVIMTTHKDERAIHTFNFKRFLQHAQDDVIETTSVIQSLRKHLCHPEFPRIVIADLGENVGFILDRLLRLEIKHLKFQEDHTLMLANHLKDFIGSIYEESGKSSVTATLLPIPSGDTVMWYALTCAHVLEMIELSIDHGSAHLSFLKSGLPKFHLESITIFKKKPVRIVNIGEDTLLTHNTIYLNDIRALPRYDGTGGDVALCKLNVDKQLSNFLMMVTLNISQPMWINSTQLRIEKYTDFYKRQKINIDFHFINDSHNINTFVQQINASSKTSNFIFGLTPGKDIILSRARNPSTEIYPSHLFVDPSPPESLDNLSFFHDAPTCKGMSGGFIFQITNQNQIDVFGVVKGCRSPRNRTPENVTRCVGSFLQKELIIKEKGEESPPATTHATDKEQCNIM